MHLPLALPCGERQEAQHDPNGNNSIFFIHPPKVVSAF